MPSKVWFGQGLDRVRVPGLYFRVEEVSGEWRLYSYILDANGDGDDMVKPSTHKSEAAAKRRARRIYAGWLRDQLTMVEGK